MCEEFNGWSNRETWAVALWIDNDYALNETALEYATEVGKTIEPYELGESLKNYIEEDLLTFENVSVNRELWLMLTDIGSLYRVNWRELADHYLDQAKESLVG